MKKVSIAVISDLHCHPSSKDEKDNCTRLFTDLLRDNVNLHPVASLIEYHQTELEQKYPNIDFLLCPGDVTNYSNLQGFISGWDYVQEISSLFGANKTYATLGNHDIDSRHKHSNYFLTIPKGIRKDFPISEDEIGKFWEKGFTFIEKENVQILIINTTHFHTHVPTEENKNPTIKGEISSAAIHEIDKYLRENKNEKIKIMMCHHHPIQHANSNLGAHDFVENGEDLIAVLAKHKYDLVIHGHKHDPKFKNYTSDNGNIPILSSGSFSATNQISFTNKFNYFHLIEIEKEGDISRGTIKTPNYKYQVGWQNTSDGFHFLTGFGAKKSNSEILQEILTLANENPVVEWTFLCDTIEDLKFIMPSDLDEILSSLSINQYGIDKDYSNYPKTIYNNKKLREIYGS